MPNDKDKYAPLPPVRPAVSPANTRSAHATSPPTGSHADAHQMTPDRPGEWDETSEEATSLPIEGILRLAEYQARTATDRTTVLRYASAMRSGAPFPPVTVANVEGALVLVDGFHRVEAYQNTGASMVLARVVTATPAEARWMAAEANMRHGKPLSRRELRGAFRAFIRAGKHLTPRRRLIPLRQLARDFGAVAHTTLRNWLIADFPAIARKYAGEGAGGSRGTAPDQPNMLRVAEEHLAQAGTASAALATPVERGTILLRLEELMRRVQAAGPIETPLPPDF